MPGHADVVERVDLVAEASRRDADRLARHRQVRGPGAHDGDRALADDGHLGGAEPEEPPFLVVVGLRERAQERRPGGGVDAGHEHRLPCRAQRPGDLGDLPDGLALAEDDLGQPTAERAVGVDARVRGIDEGELRQALERRLGVELPPPHLLEQGP